MIKIELDGEEARRFEALKRALRFKRNDAFLKRLITEESEAMRRGKQKSGFSK